LAIGQGFFMLRSEVEKPRVWTNREWSFFQVKVCFIHR
jgi:hypothetical protein